MYLIQFLLPLRDNERRPFPRADFERVRAELTERFGGVTAFLQAPASGVWKDAGETTHDELVLFEVMTDALDRAWWKGYRAELERRFRQEALVVRALESEHL
ncbi:hypothetical protein [Hyalangium sp.]|uniref:hypothetical protein n=1 Tax=Hyalangium sp. TaxID=2028555 RepID=UPI002D6A6578|nr:hypothetical protein [Hyalangium sp.]HYH95408.1 hypothetical protein [Hyalangium sp.]